MKKGLLKKAFTAYAVASLVGGGIVGTIMIPKIVTQMSGSPSLAEIDLDFDQKREEFELEFEQNYEAMLERKAEFETRFNEAQARIEAKLNEEDPDVFKTAEERFFDNLEKIEVYKEAIGFPVLDTPSPTTHIS
jgi:hypothetical protein